MLQVHFLSLKGSIAKRETCGYVKVFKKREKIKGMRKMDVSKRKREK